MPVWVLCLLPFVHVAAHEPAKMCVWKTRESLWRMKADRIYGDVLCVTATGCCLTHCDTITPLHVLSCRLMRLVLPTGQLYNFQWARTRKSRWHGEALTGNLVEWIFHLLFYFYSLRVYYRYCVVGRCSDKSCLRYHWDSDIWGVATMFCP